MALKAQFLEIANEYLSQSSIGPVSLAELLETIYDSGTIDERYGDFGASEKKRRGAH